MFFSAGMREEAMTGTRNLPAAHYNEHMLVLRYAYVLALAVWTGGMIILGAIAAPAIFQVLPMHEPEAGRALAGATFGEIIARFHYVAYAAGGVMLAALGAMALLGPRPRHLAIRMAVIAGMLAVAIYSGVVVLGEIDGIQRELATTTSSTGAGSTPVLRTILPSQLAVDDRRRLRFDALHRLSERLMMIDIAGALVLLFWEAREEAGSRR